MSFMPQHIIDAAVNKLPPLAIDSDYLNKALTLGSGMFINPAKEAMASFAGVGLDSIQAPMLPDIDGKLTIPSIPGFTPEFAAQCTDMHAQMKSMLSVTDQMFTQVMPYGNKLPENLTGLMNTSQVAMAGRIGVPSIAQTLSAVQSEQQTNAKLGLDGDNPCLAVTNAFSGLMSGAHDVAAKIKESIIDPITGFLKPAISGAIDSLKTAGATIAGYIESAKTAVGDALAAIKDNIQALSDKVSGAIATAKNLISDVTSHVTDFAAQIGKTIGAVYKSIETSMHVAMAELVKNLASSNPCMRQVLMPDDRMDPIPDVPATDAPPIPDGSVRISGDAVVEVEPQPTPNTPQLVSPDMKNAVTENGARPLPPMSDWGQSFVMTRHKVTPLAGAIASADQMTCKALTPKAYGNLAVSVKVNPASSIVSDWTFSLSSSEIGKLIDEANAHPDWTSETTMKFNVYEFQVKKSSDGTVLATNVVLFYFKYDESTDTVSFYSRLQSLDAQTRMAWDTHIFSYDTQ